MFRLAHAPSLDIFRDGTAGVPLEAGLQLALAHAGYAGKAGEGNVKGVVIGNVAYHIFESFNICSGKRVCVLRCLLFLIVHHKSDSFRDLCFIEQRSGNAVPAVVFVSNSSFDIAGKSAA